MQCEKPSRVHGDGIQKQNEKSKGICVNFSLRMEQGQNSEGWGCRVGGTGAAGGGRPAMRHKPTTDPERKRLLRTGRDNNFFIDKEKNCRATIFIEYFCPQSRNTQATVCGFCMYVCVCVACQYPEHVRSLCQRLQNSLHSNNTSRSPCRVAASQNSADPNICSTFQQQFRYAIYLPHPVLTPPSAHKSCLGCHKCLHFGSCCCAAKVFLAQVAQFPLTFPPFPSLSLFHSVSLVGLLVWFDAKLLHCISFSCNFTWQWAGDGGMGMCSSWPVNFMPYTTIQGSSCRISKVREERGLAYSTSKLDCVITIKLASIRHAKRNTSRNCSTGPRSRIGNSCKHNRKPLKISHCHMP